MNEQLHLHTEGDINLNEDRRAWREQIMGEETKALLERDANVFSHQVLSSPCLDVLNSSDAVYLKNRAGDFYIDFHGNNVHQLGYNNRYIIIPPVNTAAANAALDHMEAYSLLQQAYWKLR